MVNLLMINFKEKGQWFLTTVKLLGGHGKTACCKERAR